MKIIVTGGRTYSDYDKVQEVLDKLQPSLIIQGGAGGADDIALKYAIKNGIEKKTYHANWDLHGRAAGPIRNILMLEENQDAAVVAFPGGKGTEHCKKHARKLGMEVYEIA